MQSTYTNAISQFKSNVSVNTDTNVGIGIDRYSHRYAGKAAAGSEPASAETTVTFMFRPS